MSAMTIEDKSARSQQIRARIAQLRMEIDELQKEDAVMWGTSPRSYDDALKAAVAVARAGNRIEGIRQFRAAVGCGLREAVDAVDRALHSS